MDSKTNKTKILMLSCLVHNSFLIHKPPPNPPFQQHFCGKFHTEEIIFFITITLHSNIYNLLKLI